MELTTAHYVQLMIAAGAGLAFFVALYLLPARVTYAGLVLLIPFQIVDSRYGSLNVILTYMLFAAYLLLGRVRYLPLAGPTALVLLAYSISYAFAPTETWIDHGFYMFSFLTNFLVFYLAYNTTRQHANFQYLQKLFITLNVLVVLYCFAQVILPNQYAIGGISELAMGRTRGTRLTGPFNATAATADYLALMCVFILYSYLHEKRPPLRAALIGLIGVNTSVLLMTGNRGGFIILLAGITLFLWSFRNQLGGGRVIRLAVAGMACVAVGSALVFNFSRFNVMYERLVGTQIESGVVPDTRRASWENAWEEIVESPITGHGPQFRLGARNEIIAGMRQIDFAHSLPLHVLYTTGALGLMAYLIFFTALGRRIARHSVRLPGNVEPGLAGLPRLGTIIFTLFLVSELRIEMLRMGLNDYQHLVFMLLGTLLAFSDHIARVEAPARSRARPQTLLGGNDELPEGRGAPAMAD